MSETTVWIVIIGLTCVTVATRSAFLVLGTRYTLPERLQHALRHAPVCALVALIAPELALASGSLELSFSNPKLVAGIGAAVVMVATRNMVAAMAVGMLAFTALRLLAA
ncbi:MAG: AzlD domain-containing protein [Burkholderiaceae bacterium]